MLLAGLFTGPHSTFQLPVAGNKPAESHDAAVALKLK